MNDTLRVWVSVLCVVVCVAVCVAVCVVEKRKLPTTRNEKHLISHLLCRGV
jgi:hypothetical protein